MSTREFLRDRGNNDENNNDPRLAIGWIIPGSDNDGFKIVDRIWNIEDGETIDGEYLNPPLGHFEVWEDLRKIVGMDIYPYEFFPRFRVVAKKGGVINSEECKYEVWGDEKILVNTDWQDQLILNYNLPREDTEFLTDGVHYFSANPDSELVWDPEAKELKLIIDSYDDVRETLLSESPAKGIFWMVGDELVYERIPCDENGVPLEPLAVDAVSKSGSTYNHERYWGRLPGNITGGKDYKYYPRGRVEIANGRAKIYLNPEILNEDVEREIIEAFKLSGMPIKLIADGSSHYESYLDKEE